MRTKNRLNVAFFGGSVVMAALIGGLTGSGGVFVVALIVLLGLNIANHKIR